MIKQNKSMKKILIYMAAVLMSVMSCTEMDLPPKNTVTDDDLLSDRKSVV